ncbi:MAG TPA: hypothetical protein VEG08_00975 [Terriglobales bacterium]|nr:hypothetical protein [Terriglobales bacterium]
MPVDVHVVHGGAGRLFLCRGAVTGREFIARNQEMLSAEENYLGTRWCLIDQTGATSLDISSAEIQTIVEQDARLAVGLPELVIVVVVARDLGFGLSRMWEMLTERPGWSVRVLRARTEAEAWLREEVRRKFGMELPAELATP